MLVELTLKTNVQPPPEKGGGCKIPDKASLLLKTYYDNMMVKYFNFSKQGVIQRIDYNSVVLTSGSLFVEMLIPDITITCSAVLKDIFQCSMVSFSIVWPCKD